jgi:glycolate oxidase iron-sulfur subunit
LLSRGDAEAIVASASACSLAIKEYGHALAHDPDYRDRAARVASLALDLSELLPDLVAALKGKIESRSSGRLAYHPPCTLQHGQKLRGGVVAALRELGFAVEMAPREPHLCCGSAGTYSLLQPGISRELRDRKLAELTPLKPACIVSANVGCIGQLQSGTSIPVKHWVEVLDEALPAD